MEPEGSLPCSQEPATCPNPERDDTIPRFPPYFPKIQSYIIFLPMPWSSTMSLLFRFSDKNFVCNSHVSHPCYMPRPSHPPHYAVLSDILPLPSSCPNIVLSAPFSVTLDLSRIKSKQELNLILRIVTHHCNNSCQDWHRKSCGSEVEIWWYSLDLFVCATWCLPRAGRLGFDSQ
jgi:hypothetical protein